MSSIRLALSTAKPYGLDRAIARTGLTNLVADNKPTRVIVAMGDGALRQELPQATFTVDQAHAYCLPHESGAVVIPTYDLTHLWRAPDYEHWIDWALRKALRLYNGTRSLDAPINCITSPTLAQIESLVPELLDAPLLSVDIECIPESCELTSIAFATETFSLCIPLAAQYLQPYWSDPADELKVWEIIQTLLASPTQKVFHNFIFDTQVLRYAGIETNGAIHDTMVRASALNPLLPKGLKDVARLYLYCEPWKDQKDFKLTGDADAFYRYNAIDAARTLSIWGFQESEFQANTLKIHYDKYVAPLAALVQDTCEQGIRVNVEALKAADETATKLLEPLEAELASIANPLVPPAYATRKRNKEKDVYGPSPKTGKQIIIQKGYNETRDAYNPRSPEQTKVILETLGYKIPTKRGKLSADREALLKLNRRKPSPFIAALLRHSKLAKLRSSYTSIVLEEDLRCRFSLNIAGTISGRFSAQKTPWDTGLNVQTLPRRNAEYPIDIRGIFVPELGHTMVEVDLSQAELRIVAWLSGDPTLCNLLDTGQDVHQYVADAVTKQTGLVCTRQLGKRINHAKNYGMGPAKFSDSCLMEANLSIRVEDAEKLLAAQAAAFPFVTRWQQSIRTDLYKTRRLESPLGRAALFYGKVDDEMHRQALSFIPQATVVDTINAGWIALAGKEGYGTTFRVLTQIHDSLVFSVQSDKLDYLVKLINEVFAMQYITIHHIRHVIPHDIKVGPNLGAMKELK